MLTALEVAGVNAAACVNDVAAVAAAAVERVVKVLLPPSRPERKEFCLPPRKREVRRARMRCPEDSRWA